MALPQKKNTHMGGLAVMPLVLHKREWPFFEHCGKPMVCVTEDTLASSAIRVFVCRCLSIYPRRASEPLALHSSVDAKPCGKFEKKRNGDVQICAGKVAEWLPRLMRLKVSNILNPNEAPPSGDMRRPNINLGATPSG